FLYSSAYDELFRRVPHHPQVLRKLDAHAQAQRVSSQINLLREFLTPETVFMEVGAGDCSLSISVAALVKKVYAVEVSEEIISVSRRPENVSIVVADGCGIPVPKQSITLAYSNQLIEHLHPDDVLEHLK